MQNNRRISSLVNESPPQLSETTPDKSLKNFSTQYLGTGMWPSKTKHNDESQLINESMVLIGNQPRLDRRQAVSQSVHVPGDDRMALAAQRAALHYVQKARQSTTSNTNPYGLQNHAKLKIPPLKLSLTNALNTAEKSKAEVLYSGE